MQTNSSVKPPGAARSVLLGFALFLTVAYTVSQLPFDVHLFAQSDNGQPAAMSAAAQVDWLEPRGLNIVDMVGLVPEDHLVDLIVASSTPAGIAQYVSGQRNGNTVTINLRMSVRYGNISGEPVTTMNCLGQLGVYDQWPGAAPAALMRVFANGADVTSTAYFYNYIPAGQILPSAGSSTYYRYAVDEANLPTFSNGSLEIPANMGCIYLFHGQHSNVTAQFTVEAPARINISSLGSETFVFHSYIGTGSSGRLASLNSQMQKRYGNRHEKFTLNPPAGSEYVLVKFPPTPADPYAGEPTNLNTPLPTSATYRIGRSNNALSVDHVNSMGLPLYGQWQDADQSGETYLPFFRDGARLGAPEMFLPAGVPYEPCMTNGGCTPSLLEQVHTTAMNITVYYYRVDRVVNDLTRIPLRQVGRSWRPGNQVQASAAMDLNAATIPSCDAGNCVYLPVIHAPPPTPTAQPTPIPTATPNVPPDDPTGCPCGWFDSEGRMVDYIAPP